MIQEQRPRPELLADFSATFGKLGWGLFTEAIDMAGDWIKMRHDLPDDPAVIYLAENTDCVDEDHVIGKLQRLWSWADRQTTDGHAPSVTLEWVDRFCGCRGFAAALTAAGWLAPDGRGFSIPHFDTHISQSAKTRALANKRQARGRHASSVTKTRPEKRREEKSIPPVAPRISVGLDFDKDDPRPQPQPQTQGEQPQ